MAAAISRWPELLAFASLALIGFFIWDRLFRLKHPVVHLSCFVYRDVNRNGVYDLGDRPYAGLPVTIRLAGGRPTDRNSNLSGFANFDMSLGSWNAEIRRPGVYVVHSEPPSDWDITSSNQTQSISIQKHNGSAVGLIARKTIDAVGLAPRLRISGRISPNVNVETVRAFAPEGQQNALTTFKDGLYSLRATSGVWRFEYVHTNGAFDVRHVAVENYPVIVSKPSADRFVFAAKPKLKVIDFDHLTSSGTLLEIPNGYEGLNWRNWVAAHQKFYEGTAFVNINTSGEYVAYTSSGHPATISSPQTFDFVGVCIGVAWNGAEPHEVVVKAWRNDLEVYRDHFQASTTGPIYFDADYRSITQLEFASDGYWQVLIDDLTIRTQ